MAKFSAAAAILLSLAATTYGGAMMAAPDETPLLLDRLRAFPSVVVASTEEGFDKKPTPVKGTNSVYLPVKIESVLKGEVKEGKFRLSVHERLPALLAQRDGNGTTHKYLLAMALDKGTGYLGGGQLYTDLGRFYLTDAGMEKVAKAFIEANDVAPAALLTLGCSLLADKDVTASATATGHVCEVLARLAAKSGPDEWKTMSQAVLQTVINRAAAQLRAGVAVDTAAAVLNAVADRADNPEGVKATDGNLAEPARKWLAAQLEANAVAWTPDYQSVATVTPVVKLLGRLKDKDAKDLVVKQTKDARWAALRRPALAAFKDILTPEDQKALQAPAAGDFPPGIRRSPKAPLVPVQPDDI